MTAQRGRPQLQTDTTFSVSSCVLWQLSQPRSPTCHDSLQVLDLAASPPEAGSPAFRRRCKQVALPIRQSHLAERPSIVTLEICPPGVAPRAGGSLCCQRRMGGCQCGRDSISDSACFRGVADFAAAGTTKSFSPLFGPSCLPCSPPPRLPMPSGPCHRPIDPAFIGLRSNGPMSKSDGGSRDRDQPRFGTRRDCLHHLIV
ncbi:hypothetical protein F5X68DRAFT_25548 [Plectosphaerella plurivora]|uniref:Uncharacterized protein n=1 Tax=Plectosphaerella plurivora TaxID=936078 RepID=A0A9P8V602_9PEZI|nr:hypothetical protein F5X68DRAFT_25548 [Plectosphaerella plurivora]